MSNYPYYDPQCKGYSLQQRLVIPTTPVLYFNLGPDDIVYETQDAGKNILVKYGSFTRDIKAVLHHCTVTLQNISVAQYESIVNFAELDFKNNVRGSGRGSVTLYHRGKKLDNLYIGTPIEAPKGWFTTWAASPEEILDTVTLRVFTTEAKWF